MPVLAEGADIEERDVDSLTESLYKRKDDSTVFPTCISSVKYWCNLKLL